MSNFDFTPYDDVANYNKYDGFFDQEGRFYKVKLRRSSMFSNGHNEWAEQYMKEHNMSKLDIPHTYSALLNLSKLNGPAEVLINCYGFAYYGHDPIYYKPIIILPDPKIAGYKATSEQIESLFKIMLLNNEKPYNKEILIDSNILIYNGLDEEMEGKIR